jgi:hypothetical protein
VFDCPLCGGRQDLYVIHASSNSITFSTFAASAIVTRKRWMRKFYNQIVLSYEWSRFNVQKYSTYESIDISVIYTGAYKAFATIARLAV